MTRLPVRLGGAAALALLTACAAGPDYRRITPEMPAAWKTEAPWRAGRPNDAAPKGPWWRRFGDPELDALIGKALADSPTLALATARLAQARASLGVALAARAPQVGLNLRDTRQRISANRPLTNYNSANQSTVQSDYVASLSVSYEADLFGRGERAIEGAQALAAQSGADLENVRLLLTADLATAYFNLRALDMELDVVSRSLALQRRVLELARSRHELGATSGLDVAQQQALVDSTLTQVDILTRQRAQFEHAIATLTGTPAPAFSLPVRSSPLSPLSPPAVPIGVPSDVLERRPDVAGAERAMAAANAQIGVATAAFYPSITLGGTYGSESRDLSRLFDAPSLLWSLGATLVQPLFNGGRNQAALDSARAGHDAAVAGYRRVVLTAMQEVEDGITGMTTLERAHAQSLRAVASANRVFELASTRYEGGVATYLDVISAQQSLLTAERQSTQLLGQRLVNAVFLIKALGGDWQAPGTPAADAGGKPVDG